MIELFAANVLNKGNLVLHRFQLPQRFIVIEQLDIQAGEVTVIQHLGYFFAFERARAHYCKTVKVAAAQGLGMGDRNGFGMRTHET